MCVLGNVTVNVGAELIREITKKNHCYQGRRASRGPGPQPPTGGFVRFVQIRSFWMDEEGGVGEWGCRRKIDNHSIWTAFALKIWRCPCML